MAHWPPSQRGWQAVGPAGRTGVLLEALTRITAAEHGAGAGYEQECFGPVSYLVAMESAQQAAKAAECIIRSRGALTLSVYSSNQAFVDAMIAVSRRARVALSINLTKGVFVNQSAAFSDFHATGGNPAANASYTNTAFVADRFVVVQRRQHAQA